MSRNYKFHNLDGVYFISFAVVEWGGFYIEYNYNGKHQFWMLDKMKSNVPTSLHAFIDKLNEKLNYLETSK